MNLTSDVEMVSVIAHVHSQLEILVTEFLTLRDSNVLKCEFLYPKDTATELEVQNKIFPILLKLKHI